MKNKSILLSLVFAFIFFKLEAQSNFKKLVFNDEFSVSGLPDSFNWNYEEGFKRNKEAQYYTKARKENAIVRNGKLEIVALKENYKDATITSASLTSRNKFMFTYSKVEIRAKILSARGTWPALWMLRDETQIELKNGR